MSDIGATLLIACGALAPEILSVTRRFPGSFELACLPADWHNAPERIAPGVLARIRADRTVRQRRILVLYGDCGSGGRLDAALEDVADVERIPGPHCYQFYAGPSAFAGLSEAAPGTFFLTDYLVRHFDRLVWEGLGLDRHPELKDEYFRHYTRLIYLAQSEDPELTGRAREAAGRLGLAFARRFTGLGELGRFLENAARTKADA